MRHSDARATLAHTPHDRGCTAPWRAISPVPRPQHPSPPPSRHRHQGQQQDWDSGSADAGDGAGALLLRGADGAAESVGHWCSVVGTFAQVRPATGAGASQLAIMPARLPRERPGWGGGRRSASGEGGGELAGTSAGPLSARRSLAPGASHPTTHAPPALPRLPAPLCPANPQGLCGGLALLAFFQTYLLPAPAGHGQAAFLAHYSPLARPLNRAMLALISVSLVAASSRAACDEAGGFEPRALRWAGRRAPWSGGIRQGRAAGRAAAGARCAAAARPILPSGLPFATP